MHLLRATLNMLVLRALPLGPLHRYGIADTKRQPRYYHLTVAGHKRLARGHSKWADFVNAATRVMGPFREVRHELAES
jgi:hypothetical protein